jgi:ribosomal-protein-alanine N-acetyltransferase
MIGALKLLFAPAEPAIVEATAADAADIASLHAVSFRRGWSEDEVEALLIDRAVLAHRARLGRHFAGFILSRRAADESEILSVAIAPRRRGRGIARRMLDLHLRRLAGLGIRTVFLEVDETNESAHRLYARAGFREVGRRAGYYPKADSSPAAAVVLRRDL